MTGKGADGDSRSCSPPARFMPLGAQIGEAMEAGVGGQGGGQADEQRREMGEDGAGTWRTSTLASSTHSHGSSTRDDWPRLGV